MSPVPSPVPWSFHTHSAYCDGEGTLREIVESAITSGLTDLGFSSHAPLPFSTDWNMPAEKLDAYIREISSLRAEFSDRINLWLGAELDLMLDQPSNAFQRDTLDLAGFDYFVGSVHFLGKADSEPAAAGRPFDGSEANFRDILTQDYGGEIEAIVTDYYARVSRLARRPGVRIIGHFDVIKRWNHNRTYFSGNEPWYRDAVETALSALRGTGQLVELNTAGWRKNLGEPYPSAWILRRCHEEGIPVTVSSGAHSPDQLTWGYDHAAVLLSELGIEPVNPADAVDHG